MPEAELVITDLVPPLSSLHFGVAPDIFDVTGCQEMPRRLYVKTVDSEKHGYTTVCSGCMSLRLGGPRTGHSEVCRQIISALISAGFDGRKRGVDA